MQAKEYRGEHPEQKIAEWLENHPLWQNLISLVVSMFLTTTAITLFGSAIGYNVPVWSVACSFAAGCISSRLVTGQVEAGSRGKNGQTE